MEKKQILAVVNEICKNTLMETLKIEYVDVGENFLQARMPVNKRVYQPDGILHGGATAALAPALLFRDLRPSVGSTSASSAFIWSLLRNERDDDDGSCGAAGWLSPALSGNNRLRICRATSARAAQMQWDGPTWATLSQIGYVGILSGVAEGEAEGAAPS